MVDEVTEWGLLSPTHLDGSPVLLHATVADPDATAARMVEHGAQVVIPIAEQFYGRREGRVPRSIRPTCGSWDAKPRSWIRARSNDG